MVGVIVTGLLLTFAEVGYRCGLRWDGGADEPRRSQIAAVQAAVLGLLGLLLGFTFSMAVDRYDTRREFVVQEANAIRTAWLRGSLLSSEHRRAVRHLLQNYVDVRILSREAQRDPQLLAEAVSESRGLQARLWQHADAAAREAPNDMTALFIETLSQVTEADIGRIAASRNRIPSGVWVTVLVVATVGCWTSAYASGAYGARSPLTKVLLPLLVSVVILLIFDLTNERRGIIRVGQQPLIDVQNSLR
jgi:hypothetical protein